MAEVHTREGYYNTERIYVACSDETTALATGIVRTFRSPNYDIQITDIGADVVTAPTGSTLIVDVLEDGSTIMTTNKISIDAGEFTSETAATAREITDSFVDANSKIEVQITQVGSTIAGAGLKVWIEYERSL